VRAQNEVVAQYESQRHDTETVLNLRESELQDQRNRIDELKRVFMSLEANLALRYVEHQGALTSTSEV
jgi:hypothetical protein